MRNFAVKFAILAAAAGKDAGRGAKDFTREYLDLEPMDALQAYKRLLGATEQGVLMFGFSDQALLDILDEEFDVDMDNQALVFRKPFLDSRSIRLAGGGRVLGGMESFTAKEQALIRNLAVWLFDATRELYRSDLTEARVADIQEEAAENVRVYVRKCVPPYEESGGELLLRSLFASAKAMSAFSHSLTVDAMFKADAAKVVFGEQSGYHQAWFRKQIFRHMMSKAVEQFITNCIA